MKRIGKKVALLLAVVAMMGGYTYAEQTVDELQENAWKKIVNNKAGELTAGERESILKTVAKFGLIDSIDRYVKLNSTYGQVIGGDNHAVDSNSIQGRAVYGGNHQYVSDAAATIGNDGNNFGSNAVAIGYQPTAFGENAIAMGTNSVAFPLRATQIGSSNAIGAAAWAGNLGNAYGAFAKAMGTGSIAIGVQSSAGVPDIKRYLLGGGKNQYEYQPYFSQLQEKYPDVFGAVNPAEDSSARSERIGKLIFEHYKAYFSSIKISSFDVLKERVTEWESVLQQLGWHMVLSKDGSDYTTALGFRSEATAAGGVALGAFSEADRGTVTVKAPFSEVTLTDQNTLGAVSVGNKTHGRQLINVADGTEDTDAVNLRQLKALNKKVDGKKDIHFFSSNGLDSDINYDNQGARAGFATAIGPDAMATEENSQAFGFRAKAIGHSSIVFGVESTASGARDIAIGYGTHAVGSDNTITSWDDTIAIGFNALSRGGSFASGSGAVAGGSGSVALGAGAYVGTKWLDDETQKAQNVNKWVLTRSFLDKGLRDELKAKFPEKFAEWEQRAKSMPDAMGSDYLEQKLRTLAMEQLPQMTSPSMNNKMKDMGSSIAIGRGAKVYSAFAIAIGSEAKVGENLDDAIALGNQSLATRKAGGFGYDPTSDATTWTAFKKVHPEVGVGAAREQEITRELNNIEVEMNKMGNEYAAWIDKEQHYDNYKEERKAYAESHGSTLGGNNEWVDWIVHVRDEQQKLKNKGQVLYDKFSVLQKELNSGKGAWVGGKAALAIGNEEAGVTRQITGVAAGTKDTDAVNVAQLKVLATLPMNMYFGGKVENNIYTPGKENWSMPLNEFRMDFGDGLKATQVTDKDGKKYTLVTLDKESLKGDPAFKGDKGESGQAGKDGTNGKSAYDIWLDKQTDKTKTEQDFLNSLKGKDGQAGATGKSAYQVWKELQNPDGSKPNENKSEQDFFNSLKGKDGQDGKNGVAADVTVKASEKGKDINEARFVINIKKPEMTFVGDSNIKTSIEKDNTVKIALKDTITAKTIKVGEKVKINDDGAIFGDVKIDSKKGTITGLTNKTWDSNNIESGRAATEDQLKQVTQNMQNHIYEIGKHMNGIAASNAALAGLHPLEYDEDDKWNLSAAIGNYKGANAFALGAFYQPNERTMLSIGGTLAGEEHLLNVGLSLKTGPGTAGKVYVSRAAMAREIKVLKEKDARRDEQLNQQKAEIKALKEKEAQRDEQIRKLTEMIVKLQRRA